MKSIINKSKTACSPAWPLDMGTRLNLVTQRKTFLFFILCLCVYNRILLYSPCWPQTWGSCLSLPVLKLQTCATDHTWQEKSSYLEICELLSGPQESNWDGSAAHMPSCASEPSECPPCPQRPCSAQYQSFSVRSYWSGCWTTPASSLELFGSACFNAPLESQGPEALGSC